MTRITRRTILRAGAAALAAPALLRAHDALATSGTVAVYAPANYFSSDSVLADFTNATGINVTLATYATDAEAENALRASGGRGYDLAFLSVEAGPAFYKDNLLQPLDERRFHMEGVTDWVLKKAPELGADSGGRLHMAPFVWGTEGLTWNKKRFSNKRSGAISYGDLWGDGLAGQVAVRPTTVFDGVAVYLDATGTLKSNRGLDLYKSEDDSRRVFDGCLAFLLAHKANIGVLWTSMAEALAAFTDKGCAIGQTDDIARALLLGNIDPPWRYGMPKEGGLGWMQGFAIPAGAANAAQAYELANFLYRPLIAARFANATALNSCAKDVGQYLSAFAQNHYDSTYPAGTFDNLVWLPARSDVYTRLRDEYAAKLAKG